MLSDEHSLPIAVSSVRAPILVLGIGNILLRDEGVGVRAVESFQESGRVPPGVDVVDGGTGGAGLVDLICGRRKLVVVDAMQADAEPGTILRLTVDDLVSEFSARLSLHEVGLLDTLNMVRLLGEAPEKVVILGIQPAEICPGDSLTERVRSVLPAVLDAVCAECM
jgi:hydrogenase maturation protease